MLNFHQVKHAWLVKLNLSVLSLKKVAVIDNVSSTLLEALSQICFPVSCRLYTFVG